MKISAIKEFLTKYVQNRIDECDEIMADCISIEYSTLGIHTGKECVKKALRTDGEFACRYNVISNIISYTVGNEDVVILNGFHYFVRIIRNEYWPLILGGKYKFLLENNKIKKVLFFLEAEMGNTYLAKTNWNYRLFEETKNLRRPLLDAVPASGLSDETMISEIVYKLMLMADTEQTELLETVAETDAQCFLALSTYPEQYGPGAQKNGMPIETFILMNGKLEAQAHHSLKIMEIHVEGNMATVIADMFEPTKLGFKHFDAASVYKPYYNERWEITLRKGTEGWRIQRMCNQPISRFQTIRYETLEI